MPTIHATALVCAAVASLLRLRLTSAQQAPAEGTGAASASAGGGGGGGGGEGVASNAPGEPEAGGDGRPGSGV